MQLLDPTILRTILRAAFHFLLFMLATLVCVAMLPGESAVFAAGVITITIVCVCCVVTQMRDNTDPSLSQSNWGGLLLLVASVGGSNLYVQGQTSVGVVFVCIFVVVSIVLCFSAALEYANERAIKYGPDCPCYEPSTSKTRFAFVPWGVPSFVAAYTVQWGEVGLGLLVLWLIVQMSIAQDLAPRRAPVPPGCSS